MKSIIGSLIIAATFLCTPVRAQKSATMIITNAEVITLDDSNPRAEAIAIQGNKILAAGKKADILKYKNKQTLVVDAKGKTIIPGLYDSHLHVIRGGRFYNTELRWDGVKTLSIAMQMLREQAQRTPKGQWVRVVGGWNEYQFAEKRIPTLTEINEATGDVPAFILHLYGEAYLNKAAIKVLGINEDTPNPIGGLIQKDQYGQPTGLLVAEPNALILYSTLSKLPELSGDQKINSTKLFITELNSLGVTSVMDAGGGFQNFPDDYAVTDALAKSKELTIRLPYYLFAQKPGKELEDYQRWISMVDIEEGIENQKNNPYYVQGGGENLVSSAADFENFTKPRPVLPEVMEPQLKAVIKTLVEHRWPFRLHATYNESITRFLNVIEEVNKETTLNGIIWFFDHAETVSNENLIRIKELGGGICIQHRMAYQAETFISRYGKKAALNTPPIRKMLDMGIKVGGGTDGTRVAGYNPWVAIYWLISGKSLGGMQYAAKENQLGRIEALKIYTQGSALLIGQNKDRGTIKAGYLADLAVLSENYLSADQERIKDMYSLLTIFDGKAVYGSGIFSKLAPPMPAALPEWSPVNFYGTSQRK